jgi:MFS transporter, DHA1 family, multidrug resistance protein
MDRHNQNTHISLHHHLSDVLRNRYNDLVIADSFRMLALSMISLFIPIFLLKSGYSILNVAFFELGIFVVSILGHYFVVSHISKIGVRRSMITSYFLYIILYLLFFYADSFASDGGKISFLMILLVIEAVADSMYWSSYHVYFLGVTEQKENAGKKLGILVAIPNIVSIAAPFLGGVLITGFGFKGVFLISTILLVIASYVLFFTKDSPVDIKLENKKVFDFGDIRKNLIFVIQGGTYAATGVMWPLLLFFLSINLISMGLLFLISSLVFSAVTYLGGKQSDSKGTRKITRIGAAGQGVSLIFRALSTSIVGLTIFQTMGGIFGGLLDISLDCGFYKHSHKDVGSAIMNREFYMYTGRIIITLIFLAALYSFPIIESLIFVIMVSGALLFFLNFIVKRNYSILD